MEGQVENGRPQQKHKQQQRRRKNERRPQDQWLGLRESIVALLRRWRRLATIAAAATAPGRKRQRSMPCVVLFLLAVLPLLLALHALPRRFSR